MDQATLGALPARLKRIRPVKLLSNTKPASANTTKSSSAELLKASATAPERHFVRLVGTDSMTFEGQKRPRNNCRERLEESRIAPRRIRIGHDFDNLTIAQLNNAQRAPVSSVIKQVRYSVTSASIRWVRRITERSEACADLALSSLRNHEDRSLAARPKERSVMEMLDELKTLYGSAYVALMEKDASSESEGVRIRYRMAGTNGRPGDCERAISHPVGKMSARASSTPGMLAQLRTSVPAIVVRER